MAPIQPIYIVNFDGCSKGNPGVAGAGAVLYEDGREIQSATKYVGSHHTNNEAEWMGLLLGLAMCVDRDVETVIVRGDSQLVIKQMRGEYAVKHDIMKQYHAIAMKLMRGLKSVRFEYVPRAQNARADELSNLAVSGKAAGP